MSPKTALVIGGGIAGVSTAVQLARHGIHAAIVEKAPFLGGHAATYTCKATDRCAKCGACMVPKQIAAALDDDRIEILTATRVVAVDREERFLASLEQAPMFVDPQKCSACGICLPLCPQPGALTAGSSPVNTPYAAIDADKCLYFDEQSCSRCRDACAAGAIDFSAEASTARRSFDAVVLATGFTAFDPTAKPYGFGQLPDVVTNLEVEQRLRDGDPLTRPSNGEPARRIAFIQCVGSRDQTLGHLWCSRICCGSALRMAGVIRYRQPETDVTIFYIDIQTIGRDFDRTFAHCRQDMTFVRAIPADIVPSADGRLKTTHFDPVSRQTKDADFDLVVLSVAITPAAGAQPLADALGVPLADSGFMAAPDPHGGVFICGTAKGPMSIADSISDADLTTRQVLDYLGGTGRPIVVGDAALLNQETGVDNK